MPMKKGKSHTIIILCIWSCHNTLSCDCLDSSTVVFFNIYIPQTREGLWYIGNEEEKVMLCLPNPSGC